LEVSLPGRLLERRWHRARGAGQLCDKNVMRAMGLFIPFRMHPMQPPERRLGLVGGYRPRRCR
jgi:hypothetical protein